ncbi:hypothetical protein SLU01_15140 [Sporosarcina luteola]|uniref:Uncharacterized protein n=1 Tax=Sporosarcina luteola TaxID=582850 RepID=A0A511Z6X5_9BACL|nr:hypothetical protein SLU01_15140 [Sporosarcina luteola]
MRGERPIVAQSGTLLGCHRLLISNWLAVRNWDVSHIVPVKDGGELVTHELGKWGAMPIIEEDGTVVYPQLE